MAMFVQALPLTGYPAAGVHFQSSGPSCDIPGKGVRSRRSVLVKGASSSSPSASASKHILASSGACLASMFAAAVVRHASSRQSISTGGSFNFPSKYPSLRETFATKMSNVTIMAWRVEDAPNDASSEIDVMDLHVDAWERINGKECYRVRSGGRPGKLHRTHAGRLAEWILRLDTGETELLSAEEVAAAVEAHPKPECLLRGDGIVCFNAEDFFRQMRSTAVQVPVVFPGGLRRLGLHRSYEELALGVGDLLNEEEAAGGSMLSGSSASSSVRPAQHDAKYLVEAPLPEVAAVLGKDEDDCPALLDALRSTGEWSDAHELPFLWEEDTCKVFVGGEGTGTKAHRDVLWHPLLGAVLSGEKQFVVSPWAGARMERWVIPLQREEGDSFGIEVDPSSFVVRTVEQDGLIAKWNRSFPNLAVLPGDSITSVNGEVSASGMIGALGGSQGHVELTVSREVPQASQASVLRCKPGDLVLFNASARHKASNRGSERTVALYQSYLSVHALPRSCAKPLLTPHQLDDGALSPADVFWGEQSASMKLRGLVTESHKGRVHSGSQQAALQSATAAVRQAAARRHSSMVCAEGPAP
mmetsp:Transcript_66824/g.159926  ORF Transcript_66824/g.159926 Transcript_66824/m.159926 type:complete len:587 (-) Transcript_66824:396-2156(-)